MIAFGSFTYNYSVVVSFLLNFVISISFVVVVVKTRKDKNEMTKTYLRFF